MAAKKEIKEYNYVWSGKDKKGKIVKGEMRSTSDTLVKVSLRSRGIQIDKVRKQIFSKGKKIKQSDVAVFTRQLATMLKAGVPVLQSFDIVANGHTNPSVSKLLFDIKHQVESGSSLSAAFATRPLYFDKLYCNLIGVGERSGQLDAVLERLATYQEKISAIKGKIKKALAYPIAVMAVAFLVTAIIMVFVVPSFKEVFTSFGADLPAPTLVVISISDFFVEYWYIIVGLLIGAVVGFIKGYQSSTKFHEMVDRFSLRLPILGPVFHKAAISRWCRTLASMFTAGVPLVEALDSVAGASGNVVYYNATKNIQRDVATGQGLTVSIQQQNLFPNMVIQMAQIGEESGSLDNMLNKVSDIYEEEVDDTIASISSLIEPFIIVFLGVVVGGLVVAMYLPIFKMASVV